MDPSSIPSEAVPYILYQRTQYLKKSFLKKVLLKIEGFFPSFYKTSIHIQAVILGHRVKKEFIRDMQQEFEGIENSLPARAHNILDIGCGIAGIDAFISGHYRHEANIFLLDKTKTEKQVYYGFTKKGAFYNSLEIAGKFLISQGVPKENIFSIDVEQQEDLRKHTFNLIISLLSWGFHYPVLTYLDLTYEILAPGGFLILDVRNKTEGIDNLKKRFGRIQILEKREKYTRILAIK